MLPKRIEPEAPAATVVVNGVVVPPMALPETKLTLYEVVHGQEPVFWIFQVLVKVCPGVMTVSSGTVTSDTKTELLQPTAPEEDELLLEGSDPPDMVGKGVGLAKGVFVEVGVCAKRVAVAVDVTPCMVNCCAASVAAAVAAE